MHVHVHAESEGTVGGLKTVTFPSRPILFKWKNVHVPFNS